MALTGQHIAIVGAGIGGLAAAAALGQRGARVTVFEQAPALAEVGAGIQVGPNGVSVLEALGLRDAAERVAELPDAVELVDGRSGRRVVRLELGGACVRRYGRPYWQFHRADLLALLESGAREAGAELVLGTRIGQIAEHAGSLLVVPETETAPEIEVDAVIAADGVRSPIRADWFAGGPPRFTGHVAWRGLIDAAQLDPKLVPAGARVAMGPGRHLVLYPLRGGRLLNFVAVEERNEQPGEGWMQPDEPERLREAFAGWGGDVEAILAKVERTFLWGLYDHAPLPVWTKGRIGLLGDACHPMLPYLAQGATMALEDAWVLAAELDVAPSLERGLMAYEARRAPRTARVQSAAARNGRIYHLGPGLRELANLALGVAGRVSPGGMLARFDWLYGADVVSARATA